MIPTNKILDKTVVYESFKSIPQVVFNNIRSELDELTSVEIIQEQDDGSTEEKVVDFALRNAVPETDDDKRAYSKYCFSSSYTDIVPAGTEVTVIDDMSFMSKEFKVSRDQEVEFTYIAYYNICIDEQTEEVIAKDVLLHTFTYAEYLKECPKF